MTANGICKKCGVNNTIALKKSTIDFFKHNGYYEYYDSIICWYCKKSKVVVYYKIK